MPARENELTYSDEWLAQLRVDLGVRRAALWAEYELVQTRIQSSARLRLQVTGWTMAAATLGPALAKAADFSRSFAYTAVAGTGLLLTVVHRLSFEQLETGYKLGERALNLEKEIQAMSDCDRSLARLQLEATGTRKAEKWLDELLQGRRGRSGTRGSSEVLTIFAALDLCENACPRIAQVVRTGRLRWRDFLRLHLPMWFRRLCSQVGSRLSRKVPPKKARGREARRAEAIGRARARELERSESLAAHRWVLQMQLISLAMGTAALSLVGPDEKAGEDPKACVSLPELACARQVDSANDAQGSSDNTTEPLPRIGTQSSESTDRAADEASPASERGVSFGEGKTHDLGSNESIDVGAGEENSRTDRFPEPPRAGTQSPTGPPSAESPAPETNQRAHE